MADGPRSTRTARRHDQHSSRRRDDQAAHAPGCLAGTINPGQLSIVREIMTDDDAGDIDTASIAGLAPSTPSRHRRRPGHRHARHRDPVDGTDRCATSRSPVRRWQCAQHHRRHAVQRQRSAPQGPAAEPAGAQRHGGDDLILGLAGSRRAQRRRWQRHPRRWPARHARITTTTFADNFDTGNIGNSDRHDQLGSDWVETGDIGGTTAGQIRIDDGNNALRFYGGTMRTATARRSRGP